MQQVKRLHKKMQCVAKYYLTYTHRQQTQVLQFMLVPAAGLAQFQNGGARLAGCRKPTEFTSTQYGVRVRLVVGQSGYLIFLIFLIFVDYFCLIF